MKNIQYNLRLLLEDKKDYIEVEQLLDLVFTPRRKLLSSYQLRSSGNKVNKLSYVIKDSSNSVVGSIRFWNIKVDGYTSRGLLLGPLAVHPIYQSEGLGEKLVLNSIEQASADNWNWVILVGDVDYYSKFGFSKEATRGISLGYGLDDTRLLGLDINESFLNQAVGMLIKAD
ncbi:N-acetyltransferase [Paracoccaceae bacterium]|nr:N-acetyltransferase [Paracoccaceae bacterium]